jgi:septal ring factor EnvC (AmiA/AmiB activator)
MSRIISVSVLGLIWLTTSPFCLSQTRDRRLDDALADIALLKRVVKEQDRRIADLEKAVKVLQPATAANPEKPAAEERVKTTAKAPAARWHNPLAWSQVREGMSRAQVEEILGKPASVESVIDYQTLVYKGDVPGSGLLTGTVKLTDDRVSQARPPEF